MGTKLAHSYANLFMTKFEEKYVQTFPLQPIIWEIFNDDIFPDMASWDCETLHEFINPFTYTGISLYLQCKQHKVFN